MGKEKIRVYELARMLNMPAKEMLSILKDLGIDVKTHMSVLDKETAKIVEDTLTEQETEAKKEETSTEAVETDTAEEKAEEVVEETEVTKEIEETYGESRPPVVTVMGHVDHGKTTLLDTIRNTNIASREAGGITQHIGASVIEVNGKEIVFLDTPGHEAFTKMRARGAQATDIVILVVAADDGVMPQTIEAINHAKAANIPIVVAINKIDKPNANIDRVKQQLSEQGLIPEEWGGETICVPISAKNGTGIDELLEMLLLQAEIVELKADPNRKAEGIVIESRLDKGKGPVATLLVKNGTLRKGDVVVIGNSSWGRIRAMFDDKGKMTKEVPPSKPAEITGIDSVPQPGSTFRVVENEKIAKQIVEEYQLQQKMAASRPHRQLTIEDLYAQMSGEKKEIRIILKADVHGSLEAIEDSLLKLSTEDATIKIIHKGVGRITENDVMLASASKAIVIGFNIRPESSATKLADRERVTIKLYRVIYEMLEDLQNFIEGMKPKEEMEVLIGTAEIRKVFRIPKIGKVAGCYVTDGKIIRDKKARVVRDGKIIYESKINSLRRFKNDAKEVASGYECGIMVEKFSDYKEGDIIEVYDIQEST
ncbi:MAG: translation initiation factor IF-2 [Synergistetes bacterium]|nr:translation initiation factor IF-2 [Synergistota bacterium]